MISTAKTVEEYLESLPKDRRADMEKVRNLIVEHLPPGYEEHMLWGMISYVVPLSVLPKTYNSMPLCYVSLASQKDAISLYLMNVYGDPDLSAWFHQAYEATGKKLDMGKSCVRFKKVADLPLEVIAQAIAKTPIDQFVQRYKEVKK
jgi:hypothetical protein